VGVGIATGRAYVGNLQAVDHLIWTAIGNTTHLPARLQQLIRDLDAAMVVDVATWAAGRDGGASLGLGVEGRSGLGPACRSDGVHWTVDAAVRLSEAGSGSSYFGSIAIRLRG
jgi:hypothetical protein